LAIIALPKILSRRPDSSSSASTAAAPVTAPPKRVEQPVQREIPPASKASAASTKQETLKTAAEKKPAAPPQISPAATTTSASVRTETSSPNATSAPAPSSASSAGRGEVLDQVLPEVSEKARSTIHGVVRVGVRVKVDPTGNVSEAVLDSPGPSQYFADLAVKAARRWQFSSPEADGHSIPSEWIIHFHFTPSGTKAIPTQSAP